jgi:4-hydroxybenzoate polyprenyltransferase
MITRSTLSHLRFPFSFFLLPVYLLALSSAVNIDLSNAFFIFIALHLFLYPAANGFNSYYDRDTQSIGALKHPPAVTPDLLWFSLALNVGGILVALKVSSLFAAGCLVYSLAAMAYSWDKIRIKRYPWTGWLFTGLGQGFLTFLLIAVSAVEAPLKPCSIVPFILPAACTGLFLLGYYPLTQVYQHEEDRLRGDETLSLRLDVRATFLLSLSLMTLSALAFFYYFILDWGKGTAFFFVLTLLPAAVYFVRWFSAVAGNPALADFDHANRMSIIMAGGLNIFGLAMLLRTLAG